MPCADSVLPKISTRPTLAMPPLPKRKGILLAGGSGTRLHPLTLRTSKHLLSVGEQPMIHYPLATLIDAGVREILLISTPQHLPAFEALFGDGRTRNLQIRYAVQARPEGIAQAFTIAAQVGFLSGIEPSVLALGDNLFLGGPEFPSTLDRAASRNVGATIFAQPVTNPSDYAVVELSAKGHPLSLEEKPTSPKSPYAVPGLYFYDHRAVELASTLTPSPRGELEITDLNRRYLEIGALHVEKLPQGTTWFDLGTHDALAQANQLVREHKVFTAA